VFCKGSVTACISFVMHISSSIAHTIRQNKDNIKSLKMMLNQNQHVYLKREISTVYKLEKLLLLYIYRSRHVTSLCVSNYRAQLHLKFCIRRWRKGTRAWRTWDLRAVRSGLSGFSRCASRKNLKLTGEPASADSQAVAVFPSDL
jgi:hypothetical protein